MSKSPTLDTQPRPSLDEAVRQRAENLDRQEIPLSITPSSSWDDLEFDNAGKHQKDQHRAETQSSRSEASVFPGDSVSQTGQEDYESSAMSENATAYSAGGPNWKAYRSLLHKAGLTEVDNVYILHRHVWELKTPEPLNEQLEQELVHRLEGLSNWLDESQGSVMEADLQRFMNGIVEVRACLFFPLKRVRD